jgi:hypothetical protein
MWTSARTTTGTGKDLEQGDVFGVQLGDNAVVPVVGSWGRELQGSGWLTRYAGPCREGSAEEDDEAGDEAGKPPGKKRRKDDAKGVDVGAT